MVGMDSVIYIPAKTCGSVYLTSSGSRTVNSSIGDSRRVRSRQCRSIAHMPHAFVVGVPCPGNVARCFRRGGSVAKVFVNGGVSNSGKDRDVYPGNKLTGG